MQLALDSPGARHIDPDIFCVHVLRLRGAADKSRMRNVAQVHIRINVTGRRADIVNEQLAPNIAADSNEDTNECYETC